METSKANSNNMEQYQVYNIKDTVELFKIAVSKDGNLRYPGIYGPANPLEDELRNSDNCRLLSEGKVGPEEEKVEELTNSELKLNDSKENNKNINSELDIKNLNPSTAKVEEVEIKPEHSKSSFESSSEGTEAININKVKMQTLVDLDGIGKGTAKKVLEFREIAPFINYKDLNERVPLAFGRDWKDFYIKFE